MSMGGPPELAQIQPLGPAAEADDRKIIPFRRWFLAASLVVLNLLDLVLTKWILSLGGEEANPIMAPIIEHAATPVILKLGLALLVGGLVLAAPRTSKIADVATIFAVGVYTVVVGWNIAVLIEALQYQAG